MATVLTLPAAPVQTTRTAPVWFDTAFVVLCTALGLLLLGYHPAAEDGGIYAAAVAARVHPELFPAEHGFALAQGGRSLFVPLLALWARLLHLPLRHVLLLTFVLATAATVAAARALAGQLFATVEAQRGAVLLFVVSLGLPVAGTSLYLVDPYLTARSISTPLLLLALLGLLRGRYRWSAVALVGAAAVHPIMAVCALPLFAAYAACRSRRSWGAMTFVVLLTALVMALLHWCGPAETAATRAASVSRLYWFPRQWAAYEWLGAVAPVVLLPLLARTPRLVASARSRSLVMTSALAMTTVLVLTLCLVREGSQSLLLARLQPLRLLHPVYCLFLLHLGAWLASQRPRVLHWAAALVAGTGLLLMQRSLYGHSGHVELPWQQPSNGWQVAFVWAREHTPPNALFALDADYTRAPGEDAQLFRAVAWRSALPDAAKDGGIASMMPGLAPEWLRASEAQSGLAEQSDAERLRRVRPLHATWIVLPAASVTAFACPYRNAAAQVCRLP